MKLYYSLFILIGFLFSACTKDTEILGPDPFFTGQETFQVPLFIEVYTQDGLRVSNAKVTLGASEGYTDEGGLLYFNNVTVGQSAYLIVEKEGYFQASRRFYPTSGNAQFIKIIMLSNSRIAFFNAKDGAVLPIEEKATILFPADGYVLENGEDYNGIVVIAAKPIAADDPDLSFKMPGDLVGVSRSGQTGTLGSLGMIAVEMKTPSGDKIEFKKGVEATLEMIIPPSMADKAPATIPLWYFDEYDGVWREEGTAERTGARYIGKVKHFSFWNYDAWFQAIKWGASFDFGSRGPASQVEVCITIISMNTTKCEFTNSEGIVCGLVAANELLSMEVRSICGESMYNEEIGPFSDSIMLGPISISIPGMLVTSVSGNAVTCDGATVTDGFVKVTIGGYSQYTTIHELTGAFNTTLLTCDEDYIQIILTDALHNKVSIPQAFDYVPVLNVDTITICEINHEFVELEVVGFPEHFFFYSPNVEIQEGVFIYEYDSMLLYDHFAVAFNGKTTGEYIANGVYTRVTLPDGTKVHSAAGYLTVTITHFGEAGDYITGNLSGKWFVGEPANPQVQYPLLGSFSVLRE